MTRNTLFVLAGFLMMIFSSACTKMDQAPAPVITNVSATLKTSETYTYTLPANNTDDAYQITTAASNSSISKLTTDSTGNLVYQYTPAVNFVGTDYVEISTVEETHPQNNTAKPAPGKCNNSGRHGKDVPQIVKISLNILGANK